MMDSFQYNKQKNSGASALEETLSWTKYKWSIEITPKHADDLGLIPVWVEGVYITMIPGVEIG